MLNCRPERCSHFTEFPCSTKPRKYACAHVTNSLRHACNVLRRACRKPTRNRWRPVLLWIWNASIFAGLRLPRSPGAGNTCKPSAHSARTCAEAAQRSAASTAWITANVAPRRGGAGEKMALQWLADHPCECLEMGLRADDAASCSFGKLKGECACIVDFKRGRAVGLRSARFGVGANKEAGVGIGRSVLRPQRPRMQIASGVVGGELSVVGPTELF